MSNRILLLFFCFSIGAIGLVRSQSSLHITLLNDDSLNFSKSFEHLLIQEIQALQSSRNEVTFKTLYPGSDTQGIRTVVDQALKDEWTDIVVGVGLGTSAILSQKGTYEKPTISSIIIDRELLNLPLTEAGTSGIENFAYIETPFNVRKDLEVFRSIHPYKKLAILLDSEIGGFSNFMNRYFESRVPQGVDYDVITVAPTLEGTLEKIDDSYDALYILSTARYNLEGSREFYHQINHRKIPSFALTGRDQVELGAMAGLASESFISNIARRLAIDILKITEGVNAANLPVEITSHDEDFVINMNTLKHLEIYPDFDLLNQAILLNLEETEGITTWSIESLIFEALNTNLELAAAQKGVRIADEDIKIASSNLKPQLTAKSSATWIDGNRVNNSNGQAASVSWLGNATLNQIIYSEPAMANVAIQKILKDAKNAELRETELDIILEAAQAYLSYLQAKSNVKIQNENVDVTNQNLNISRSKESLGYSGISDVYRLQTQLSQNIINLNTAVSNLAIARIDINRLLNRDQNEEFNTIDITRDEMVSLSSNQELSELVNNQRDLDRLTDFLVSRALDRLPELQQFDYSIEAQRRSLISSRRSLFLPQLSLQAGYDQPIKYFGEGVAPTGFPGLNRTPQLTVGAQISLPLFEGGLRKAQIQKDIISIAQLEDQRQDFKNRLEANVRFNMNILSASFQQVELADQAADYSQRNFDIIQDLYRQGQADIITLVDAQNASLTSQLNANNALYQLISDFLSIERASGDFYFLMDENEKSIFLTEFANAILKN